MTTPYDPYASATTALPNATSGQIPANNLGLNSTTVNSSQINFSGTQGTLLGYSGQPGAGNLYVAIVAQGGADNFGNTYATGLNAFAGNLQGVSLVGTVMDSTSTLTGTQVQQANVLNPSVNGGTAAGMTHLMTNTSGNVLGYTSLATTMTYSTNGTYYWTCPTGITAIEAYCWGAGAGGSGGSNNKGGETGGGGEFAGEPAFPVTPGQVYTLIVGAGGQGALSGYAGSSGGQTVILTPGGSTAVIANGGLNGYQGVGGAGGSGSNNTIHFDGGDGAYESGNSGGQGGAGSGGPSAEGNPGILSTSSTGAAGAAAVFDGGAGGAGGNAASNGSNGGSPGGSGGACGYNVVTGASKTYAATGTNSYYGTDAASYPWYSLRNHNGYMYQGQPSVGSAQGYQMSVMTLPYSQIQSDMAGQTITSVELYINCLHSYYSSGMYLQVNYTSQGSWGNTFGYTPPGLTLVQNAWIDTNAPGGSVINLGTSAGIGTALQSGAAKALFFGGAGESPWQNYYGYFSGGTGNLSPTLTINYAAGGSYAGNGADGQIVLSYNSGTVPVYSLSISGAAGTDPYGTPYVKGFTGPQLTLSGQIASPSGVNGSAVVYSDSNGVLQVLGTAATGGSLTAGNGLTVNTSPGVLNAGLTVTGTLATLNSGLEVVAGAVNFDTATTFFQVQTPAANTSFVGFYTTTGGVSFQEGFSVTGGTANFTAASSVLLGTNVEGFSVLNGYGETYFNDVVDFTSSGSVLMNGTVTTENTLNVTANMVVTTGGTTFEEGFTCNGGTANFGGSTVEISDVSFTTGAVNFTEGFTLSGGVADLSGAASVNLGSSVDSFTTTGACTIGGNLTLSSGTLSCPTLTVTGSGSSFAHTVTFTEGFTADATVVFAASGSVEFASGATWDAGTGTLCTFNNNVDLNATTTIGSEGSVVLTGGATLQGAAAGGTGTLLTFNNNVTFTATVDLTNATVTAETVTFETGGVTFQEGFTVSAGTVVLGSGVSGFSTVSGSGETTFNDEVIFTGGCAFGGLIVHPTGPGAPGGSYSGSWATDATNAINAIISKMETIGIFS